MVSTVSPDFTGPSRNSRARTLFPPMPSLLRSSRLSQSAPAGAASLTGSTGVGSRASDTLGRRASSGKNSKRGYPDPSSLILDVFDHLVADDSFDVDHLHRDHDRGEN